MVQWARGPRGTGAVARAIPVLGVMLVAMAALLALVAPAWAYVPPPLHGHVVDTAGLLRPDERAILDQKLDGLRQARGYAIVVLLLPSLDGAIIEDVAYDTFNTWHIGNAARDDGVLLVVAMGDRRMRIETGKGVGGALTDLESNDILRRVIGPRLRAGQIFQALDEGTTAIAVALDRDVPTSAPETSARKPTASPAKRFGGLIAIVVLGGVVAGIVVVVRRSLRASAQGSSSQSRSSWSSRSPSSPDSARSVGFWSSGGSSSSSDGSWSSGDSSSSGGSDYSGDGGSSGGGGSSDSF